MLGEMHHQVWYLSMFVWSDIQLPEHSQDKVFSLFAWGRKHPIGHCGVWLAVTTKIFKDVILI